MLAGKALANVFVILGIVVVVACNCSMFCCTLLYVHSSISIIFAWFVFLVSRGG